MRPMVQLSAITLEKLQAFSGRSSTLVTIDAPLFGSVMIMNGRLLRKAANYVEPTKIGRSTGFPAYEQRSEEHTSELQSRLHLVCRLLLEKKKKIRINIYESIRRVSTAISMAHRK